jgi:hypothetical protein
MGGATLPHALSAFMTWTGKTLPFYPPALNRMVAVQNYAIFARKTFPYMKLDFVKRE